MVKTEKVERKVHWICSHVILNTKGKKRDLRMERRKNELFRLRETRECECYFFTKKLYHLQSWILKSKSDFSSLSKRFSDTKQQDRARSYTYDDSRNTDQIREDTRHTERSQFEETRHTERSQFEDSLHNDRSRRQYDRPLPRDRNAFCIIALTIHDLSLTRERN